VRAMTTASVFYVCPAPDGDWSVFGSDISPELSRFTARDLAVEYACGIAEMAPFGEVQVLTLNGGVEKFHARKGSSA